MGRVVYIPLIPTDMLDYQQLFGKRARAPTPKRRGGPEERRNRAYPTDYPRVSQDLHRVKFPDVKEGKPSETTIRRKLYYHCAWFSYHHSRQRIFLILGATVTV